MDEPILCKTHNVPKVAMRNKRNAPMLGCPVCHGKETAPAPSPTPAPPTPAPVKPKRTWGTLLHLGSE